MLENYVILHLVNPNVFTEVIFSTQNASWLFFSHYLLLNGLIEGASKQSRKRYFEEKKCKKVRVSSYYFLFVYVTHQVLMHLFLKLLYSCYGSIKLFTKPMWSILNNVKCKSKRIDVFFMGILCLFACILLPGENKNENQRPVPVNFCSAKPSHRFQQNSGII